MSRTRWLAGNVEHQLVDITEVPLFTRIRHRRVTFLIPPVDFVNGVACDGDRPPTLEVFSGDEGGRRELVTRLE